MKVTDDSCAACGHRRSRALLPEAAKHSYPCRNGNWEFEVLQCVECGLGWVKPTPPSWVVDSFYQGNYIPYRLSAKYRRLKLSLGSWRYSSDSATCSRLKRASTKLLERLSGKTIHYGLGIPLQMPRSARILEVGVGSGEWLESMLSLGYTELSAVDIASNHQNLCRLSRAGVRVYAGQIETAELPRDHYDCIRMEHVIEHLIDPLQGLKQCFGALRKGGLLTITCPSVRAPSFKVAGKLYFALDLPRHLFHFTANSLERMLRKAGFVVKDVRPYAVPVIFLASLQSAIGRGGVILPCGLWPLISPVYGAVCSFFRIGEHLTALAQKA